MKRIATVMILALLALTSCKKDTEKKTSESVLKLGDFSLSTDQLRPSNTVDIAYNGNSKDIEGHYYFMVNTKAYPMDINFTTDQTATFTIPDSAQALAFNLKVDGKYDDNDKKGHLFHLKNDDGQIIPGSQSAMANYVMNYGSDFGIKSSKEASLKLMKQDLASHPEIKDTWNSTFLSLIYAQNKDNGKKMINDYINTLKSKADKTGKDYSSLISLYNTISNEEMAKKIKEEAVSKFPKGTIAKRHLYTLFYDATSTEEKMALFEKYQKSFDELGSIGNQMAGSLARIKLKEGDIDRFQSYTNMMTDKSSKASMFNSLAWSRAEEGEDLDFAANISKQSLDLINTSRKDMKDKPYYYTDNQYKESLDYSYNMYADTYAYILYKQGHLKDAITYQKQAIGEGKNGEMNERYIEFLSKDEQFKKVIDEAESFIKNGYATRKIKEYYKQAFMKSNTDATEFESKLANLEKEAYDNYKSEIQSKLIDEDAPNFILKNMDGKDISLASLKGKTVILDFWATWCGPCKASFPGMQEVVTKYKNDSDVVLLFVDTFESGDNREKLVTDFISKNNYSFNVVYDNTIENSRDFEVADKYGVTGIPTKVIIDKNGRMRFKSVGYGGQPEKLVQELDIMIDILKS